MPAAQCAQFREPRFRDAFGLAELRPALTFEMQRFAGAIPRPFLRAAGQNGLAQQGFDGWRDALGTVDVRNGTVCGIARCVGIARLGVRTVRGKHSYRRSRPFSPI